MKKTGLLIISLLFILLTGCQQNNLAVKQDKFIFELGQTYSTDISYYLNTENWNEQDLTKLSLMSLHVDIPEEAKITKDELVYLKVGEYPATIQYGKEKLLFKIVIEDKTAPQIQGLVSIELPVGQKLNYADYFTVSDLNDLGEMIFDDSQINSEQAGNYTLFIQAKDHGNNEVKLEVPVTYIGVGDDEEAISEVIEEEGKTRYATTLTKKNRSILLEAPYYNQFTLGAPVGCESVSLYMALRYQGYVSDMDCVSFISTTPKSPDDNPYHGFVGTVFDDHRYDILPAIFPSAFTPWANQYGKALDISGLGTDEVIKQVLKGNPVVVWITAHFNPPEWQSFDWGKGFKNTHTVCVVGYDEATQTIYFHDPYLGANQPVDVATFRSIYDIQNFGVAILP